MIRVLRIAILLAILSAPAMGGEKVRVAVFDASRKVEHGRKVFSLIRDSLKDCKRCEVVSCPIYTDQGELSVSHFSAALKKCAPGAQILHFSWNLPLSPSTEPLKAELEKYVSDKRIFVASAGENSGDRHRILRLGDTVMGRVPGAMMVGELTSEGYLAPRSSYGPELLTALKPPAGERGSSFSAALFTAQVAKALAATSSSPGELTRKIRERKGKSSERFPTSQELLGGGKN